MSGTTFSSVVMPLHREGHRFLAIFGGVTLLAFLIWPPLGWVGLGLTIWCYYFFRDPDRVTPAREGLVVSPADGVISFLDPVVPPAELELGDTPLTRISIFMDVFNCHVNRIPIGGTVTRVVYRPGKFLNASLDKASADNERNGLVIALADGRRLGVVQIAGLVARRIVCDIQEGAVVRTGERFGMIRFGSRLDVYLPEGATPLVCKGQKMVAGETVLADLAFTEPARRGEVR